MRVERVLKVNPYPPFKTVKLTHSKILRVSQWSCVGERDRVFRQNHKYYVKCLNGAAQIFPPYDHRHIIRIGNRDLRLRIKEITTLDEYDAYNYLQSFHYRGNGGFGRKAILVIVPTDPILPKVLGYARLSSSFIVNKPRDNILDGRLDSGKIAWSRWDHVTRLRYVNCVVRIARVVVHPEFRGLGLGKTLIQHALRFASNHWQIANIKPIFGEITADMLKYVPFAERAGMAFVGYTEGNLRRVDRDLRYMIRKRKLTTTEKLRQADIPDMQTLYASKTLEILNGNGIELEALLNKFNFGNEDRITPKLYSLVHSVVRFPKPTFMKGLTKQSNRFLMSRVSTALPANDHRIERHKLETATISSPIRFENVDLSFVGSVPTTQRSCAVQEAFGISPTQLETTVFKDLDLEILPGEILLVSGCSGSGKTAFLDLITHRVRPSNYPEGQVHLPQDSRIGLFRPIPDSKPLIEYKDCFGEDVSRAIYILNKAGLSEAFLYLRRFSELSEGQKYRAMVARLLNSGSNIWLADDFLSTLDPITANIVAQNVRELAEASGATLIAAAPHYESFIGALKPHRVLIKAYGWKWGLYDGSKFLDRLAN